MMSRTGTIFTLVFFGIVSFVPAYSLRAATISADAKAELIATLLAKIAELQKELAMLQEAEKVAPALLVEQAENPPTRLLVGGDQGALFLKFKLIARGKDITVKNITIKQTGLASDSIFSYFGVLEDLAAVYAPHSDHIYTLKFKKAFLIPRDSSQELTVCLLYTSPSPRD